MIPGADYFSPKNLSLEQALSKASHLAIVAHQDDLEFMAFHGIIESQREGQGGFLGVVCTDSAGSPKVAEFANISNEALFKIRRAEQKAAAVIGNYLGVLQLPFMSADVKIFDTGLLKELKSVANQATAVKALYIHTPLDAHATHRAVNAAFIQAAKNTALADRITQDQCQALGCEVWRGQEWVPPEYRIALDVSGEPELAKQLFEVFKSQLAAKRYDRAILGRWAANATLDQPRHADPCESVAFAINLKRLFSEPAITPKELATEIARSFLRQIEGE